MMKKKCKYERPCIKVLLFEMEEGIAVGSTIIPGSALVTGGTDSNTYLPDLDPWGTELGGGGIKTEL